MTLYGTPGGTPLNQNGGFQGTQPGNAVGASLQQTNPGVGLFPPNSNTNSGDSVVAAISRGAIPANVHVNNFGVTSGSGAGPNVAGGRTIIESLATGDTVGTTAAFVNNGGSANAAASGGNSFGAGGLNQTNANSAGESTQCPASGPSSVPTIAAQPVYRG
jgi:hypothetical protein